MKIKFDFPRNEDWDTQSQPLALLSHEIPIASGRTWMNCKGLEMSKRSDMVPLMSVPQMGFIIGIQNSLSYWNQFLINYNWLSFWVPL